METRTTAFHTLSPEETLELLGTGPGGLSRDEAQERLDLYGPNVLAAAKEISPWLIFLRQFQNLLIAILIAATALHHKLTLLTNNTRHFERVPKLTLLDRP